ncbi:MAG: electron transfer flavoprotein subunit alpha [Anaeromyxobacter sp.]
MDNVLLLTPIEPDGSLPRASLEALTAARALGQPVTAAVFGAATGPAVAALGAAGAGHVLTVESPALADARYATDAAAAAALARAAQASVIVAPALSRMSRIAAGLAQRLGGRVDTHVTALAAEGGALAATRWYYQQRIEAKLCSHRAPMAAAGRSRRVPGSRAPAAAAPRPSRSRWTSRPPGPPSRASTPRPPASRPSAPTPKLLFVAGAGWTKKQADGLPHPDRAGQLILGFLHAAGASLGTSKSLTDQAGEGAAVLDFMTHLNQVGQTGSTPRHPKGLATCCHGEEPHVVGWRFIRERRAVNLDASCGWARGKADVVYVADAFAVMEKVNALLAARR